jgi:hypothetical protein
MTIFGTAFDAVMNPYKNALSKVPKIVRFQLMATLALLWSMIFCVSAGLLVWLPGYIVVHLVLLAIGIFGTGWTFQRAQKHRM